MRNPKDIIHNNRTLAEWLEINLTEDVDLRGADLRGADLCWADLHEADLHEADLNGADLRWADLHEADLHGADLRGADLRGVDLHEADLRGADLHEADLRGVDLRGADLHEADLRGADLHEADGDYALFYGGKHQGWATCSHIGIGCEFHTHDEWRENYKEIGKQNGYIEEEIERYRQWIFSLDWLIAKEKEE